MQANNDKILRNLGETASSMTFWAFRYFLGRMTAHTHCFIDGLVKAWDLLDEKDRDMIKRELEEEFRRDDNCRAQNSSYRPLGADMDRQAWEKVRNLYS
jgi:hypothetical protein